MIIGITGYSGSLGNNLLSKLKKYRIIKFQNRLENKTAIKDWIKLNQFDCIIHLGSIVSINVVNKNKKKTLNVNYKATINLVNNIKKFSKKKSGFSILQLHMCIRAVL